MAQDSKENTRDFGRTNLAEVANSKVDWSGVAGSDDGQAEKNAPSESASVEGENPAVEHGGNFMTSVGAIGIRDADSFLAKGEFSSINAVVEMVVLSYIGRFIDKSGRFKSDSKLGMDELSGTDFAVYLTETLQRAADVNPALKEEAAKCIRDIELVVTPAIQILSTLNTTREERHGVALQDAGLLWSQRDVRHMDLLSCGLVPTLSTLDQYVSLNLKRQMCALFHIMLPETNAADVTALLTNISRPDGSRAEKTEEFAKIITAVDPDTGQLVSDQPVPISVEEDLNRLHIQNGIDQNFPKPPVNAKSGDRAGNHDMVQYIKNNYGIGDADASVGDDSSTKKIVPVSSPLTKVMNKVLEMQKSILSTLCLELYTPFKAEELAKTAEAGNLQNMKFDLPMLDELNRTNPKLAALVIRPVMLAASGYLSPSTSMSEGLEDVALDLQNRINSPEGQNADPQENSKTKDGMAKLKVLEVLQRGGVHFTDKNTPNSLTHGPMGRLERFGKAITAFFGVKKHKADLAEDGMNRKVNEVYSRYDSRGTFDLLSKQASNPESMKAAQVEYESMIKEVKRDIKEIVDKVPDNQVEAVLGREVVEASRKSTLSERQNTFLQDNHMEKLLRNSGQQTQETRVLKEGDFYRVNINEKNIPPSKIDGHAVETKFQPLTADVGTNPDAEAADLDFDVESTGRSDTLRSDSLESLRSQISVAVRTLEERTNTRESVEPLTTDGGNAPEDRKLDGESVSVKTADGPAVDTVSPEGLAGVKSPPVQISTSNPAPEPEVGVQANTQEPVEPLSMDGRPAPEDRKLDGEGVSVEDRADIQDMVAEVVKQEMDFGMADSFLGVDRAESSAPEEGAEQRRGEIKEGSKEGAGEKGAPDLASEGVGLDDETIVHLQNYQNQLEADIAERALEALALSDESRLKLSQDIASSRTGEEVDLNQKAEDVSVAPKSGVEASKSTANPIITEVGNNEPVVEQPKKEPSVGNGNVQCGELDLEHDQHYGQYVHGEISDDIKLEVLRAVGDPGHPDPSESVDATMSVTQEQRRETEVRGMMEDLNTDSTQDRERPEVKISQPELSDVETSVDGEEGRKAVGRRADTAVERSAEVSNSRLAVPMVERIDAQGSPQSETKIQGIAGADASKDREDSQSVSMAEQVESEAPKAQGEIER